MKIYTKTGDEGMTSLVYGKRVKKDDLLVEAYGTCDEANSMIGLAISHMAQNECVQLRKFIHQIQTDLFHVGAELSTPTDKEVQWKLNEEHVFVIENMIDQMEKELPPLQKFILPGGHPSGAAFHVARTVVRRAERLVVSVNHHNRFVLQYLNRLSDFLFVAARYVNMLMDIKEDELHS